MNPLPSAENHEDSHDTSAFHDAEADESFVTATDGRAQQNEEEDLAEDLASEVARAEAQEQGSEGSSFDSYAAEVAALDGQETTKDAGEIHTLPLESPDGPIETIETSGSSVDHGPSAQASPRSTPENSRPGSSLSIRSRHSPLTQPFEKRFHARKTSSALSGLRGTPPPAFLSSHSRQGSSSSQVTVASNEPDEEQRPWEVIKWTKLKKLSSQLFSEAGKRAFGNRSYLVIGASIVIGTSKGLITVFDYQQNLKSIIGQGTPASECGSVTALAISADHSTIAAGHSNGFLFTWDTSSPAKPFLMIPPIPRESLASRSIDGHIADQAVLHVGFLGTRHTALVSADESGMAFSHLATRGLGAVGRTVKSTRILGRYPTLPPLPDTAQKPTSVLACAPLPLGNVEQPTDGMGLTALLTPYLLVIVSTTPIAQTHFKTPRPKTVDIHSPMTGCLAWFPAVKIKSRTTESSEQASTTKLVYCWSNMLQVLEIEAERHPTDEDPKRPDLVFQQQRQWKSEEAIVGVQWISRSVLAVLTLTQRLVILDDYRLEMSDSADLNPRHIFHRDLFSRQLEPLVGKAEEGDDAMQGVVPDAYSMSFKAYRGRLFLLDIGDVSMGTLSNWADRLVALMEVGRLTQAIQLATSYYRGTTDKTTVGLPEDDASRESTVGTRILEIIKASLDYTFSKDESDELGIDIRSALQDLVQPIFTACLAIREIDFLLQEVYEDYSNASCQDMFLYALEPKIMEERIRAIPAELLKDLVNWYSSLDLGTRLEGMICALDTESLDLDQVTALCKKYNLYDALIYVWNQAIGDFVTPLDDLLALVKSLGPDRDDDDDPSEAHLSALKIFPYLACSLTGRVYPDGMSMSNASAEQAKAQLYGCLFAGNDEAARKWGSNTTPSQRDYGRLRTSLDFNSFEFMSMLNEAFEDSFLNQDPNILANGNTSINAGHSSAGKAMSREHIIKVLREVLNSSGFDHEDRIHLDIFIARNMPKFPQYIRIPGVTLHNILEELCDPPRDDLVEECQLSVEYLLSIYRPSDVQSLVPFFERAGFFRILKLIHKGAKHFPRWLQTHFDDPDEPDAVFDCISQCLKKETGLNPRQFSEVKALIIDHAEDLAARDVARTAQVLQRYAPNLLQNVFDRLSEDPSTQYNFLRVLFDVQADQDETNMSSSFLVAHTERYVQLMCKYNPADVSGFVNTTEAGNLRLDQVLPIMESTGVVDAAVVLLAKDGLVREALDRLIRHLTTLQSALTGLLEPAVEGTFASQQTNKGVDEVVESVMKYAKMGVWLCQGTAVASESKSAPSRKLQVSDMTEENLTVAEKRWLDMMDAVAGVSRAVTTVVQQSGTLDAEDSTVNSTHEPSTHKRGRHADDALRKVVQDCFTALLAATASAASSPSSTEATASSSLSITPTPTAPPTNQPPRLLPILNVFLTRLTTSISTTTSATSETLLPILSSIFAAHTFEHSLLHLATALLDKDVFVSVTDADARRRKGWRPQGRACAACGLRAWGVGAGVGVWDDWSEKKVGDARSRAGRKSFNIDVDGPEIQRAANRSQSRDKGKGRLVEPRTIDFSAQGQSSGTSEKQARALVVFACGHLFHRGCLEAGLKSQGRDVSKGSESARPAFVCLLCH